MMLLCCCNWLKHGCVYFIWDTLYLTCVVTRSTQFAVHFRPRVGGASHHQPILERKKHEICSWPGAKTSVSERKTNMEPWSSLLVIGTADIGGRHENQNWTKTKKAHVGEYWDMKYGTYNESTLMDEWSHTLFFIYFVINEFGFCC